jgi:hypothetical protein
VKRDLTRGQYVVGMAGLGLLRLHRSGDTSAAPAIVEEIASMLPRIEKPPFDEDVLGKPLELRAGYTRWATVYDLPGNPVIDHEEPVVWDLLDSLEGSSVLDAACGTGRHLERLVRAGRHTIGVDVTPAMLARARQRALGADLRKGDLLALPVEDGVSPGPCVPWPSNTSPTSGAPTANWPGWSRPEAGWSSPRRTQPSEASSGGARGSSMTRGGARCPRIPRPCRTT